MKKLYVTLTWLCRFLCIFLRGGRIFKIFLLNIFFLSVNESLLYFYCCFRFGVIFLYKDVSIFGVVFVICDPIVFSFEFSLILEVAIFLEVIFHFEVVLIFGFIKFWAIFIFGVLFIFDVVF